MQRVLISLAALLTMGVFTLAVIFPYFTATANKDFPYDGSEPDIPSHMKGNIDKQDFMTRRAEYIGLKRGVDKDKPVDPKLRQRAIDQMQRQEAAVKAKPDSGEKESLTMAWTPIGPAPIPNGQVEGLVATPVSGRVTAIAVHPNNADIVYVGTAQGGVYRSADGGTNWRPLLDSALSLAIGSIAIPPSQPETIYVGTGEMQFAIDSFFGVGVYRIDSPSSATPVVTGPLNKNTSNVDVFSGTGIGRIVVHPTNPGIIFVATGFGIGGIGASGPFTAGRQGIYRSTNATSQNPVFSLIGPLSPLTQNFPVRDIALDPFNSNRMVANLAVTGGTGGLYVSPDVLSLGPQWAQTLQLNGDGIEDVTAEFAFGPNSTVYAATGENNGTVYRSTNGGFNWTARPGNSFCGGQCFYDIAIAVDPINSERIYLGGVTRDNFPGSLTFGSSNNGGMSFTRSEAGLHTDSHVIAVAPTLPSTIYFGSDGGIYKSINSGATWLNLNNTQFSATQFVSVATHPTDPRFSIGGTQDNGTNFYRPDGTWFRVDQGDGGYALIDQNATDTTNVRMYHTYFANTSNIGYATVASTTAARDFGWTLRGCSEGTARNGIPCEGPVLFYPPLARGPGNPNTVYLGSNRLYRSADNGATHEAVSTASNTPISAIAISPQNDNFRIIGLSNGFIFGTKTGSSNMSLIDNGLPLGFISRVVFDPRNSETVYATFSRFAGTGTQNVYKTTNFTFAESPNWLPASGSGTTALPPVPVSSFVVDPADSNVLYAGTDIGVYISTNGGGAWTPFGTGLPRVAVFDMAIAPGRVLRVATHGRGMYDMALTAGPQSNLSINDVTLNEGNTGTTAFTFNVTLSPASTQDVSVSYNTANDTATAGSDFSGISGILTFTPGQTSRQLTVPVNGDTTVEPNETFRLNLSNATGAAIQNGQGNGTILNDDGGGISISDVSLNEGNAGTTAFNFNVALSASSSQTVTVNYATGNGSATAGSDYAQNNGTITFNPGELSKTVTILVTGDTAVEPNETFTVGLAGATGGATIADNQGLGTIINDDAGISINDLSLSEGNTGTRAMTFTVTLSPAVASIVRVNYATANGSASSPADYASVPSTTLTFNPNETTKSVTVMINGDTEIEPNETLNVNLSGATGATISDNQGIGTILNDDTSISINDVAQNEGNAGSTTFTFNVTLSVASSQPVMVNFATAADSASAGSDYVSTNGTLTFNPSETSKQVMVSVTGDTTIEPDEAFNVNLSNASGAEIGDSQGRGTILNDDTTISINDVAANEGNVGNTAFNFVVTLSGASSQTVSVDFITSDGSANAGSDYVAASGRLTFNPNETSKSITVQVIGNTVAEGTETFTVNLSGATGATIADGVGVGTILNDDSGAQPSLSINDVTQNEGTGGATAFVFTVNLTPGSQQVVTVNYSTADGTAIAPGDYAAVAPTTLLTFGVGELSKQVTVSVVADSTLEPTEAFTVNLANPTNAAISDNQAIGTIQNDDACAYQINPTSQSFGSSGGTGSVQVITSTGCAWTAVSNGAAGFDDMTGHLRIFDLPARIDLFRASEGGDGPTIESPAVVFQGTGVGAIPDGLSGEPPQYGAPRVISFNVSGITGPITAISSSITLNHTWVGDVDMVLRSPGGTSSLITVSRIGVVVAGDFGFSSDYSGTYNFADTATGPNIWTAAENSPIPPGTYRTTAGGGPGQDDPPPVTSLRTTFGGLSTAQINGIWTLTVRDGAAQDTGTVTTASLDITGTATGGGGFVGVTTGASGNGNGTVNYTVGANSTGAARTTTMTIAGQIFTVNQSNTPTAGTRRGFDYDGDGRADISIYRPSIGDWYVQGSQNGLSGIRFGLSTDRIVPADFDGDGKTDVAVYRPSDGTWYIVRSTDGTFMFAVFGLANDLPIPGDFDGDGRADISVFRPSDSTWYRLNSGSNNSFFGRQFGASGDKPVMGDFDGDGRADLAVFRPSIGAWFQIRSQNDSFFGEQFGVSTDQVVPADYDGDRKTDLAVYRPSNGFWYVRSSLTGAFQQTQFGAASDIPAPADYDGDGRADICVFRPSEGQWYRTNSSNGMFNAFPFGTNGDRPTQSAFN